MKRRQATAGRSRWATRTARRALSVACASLFLLNGEVGNAAEAKRTVSTSVQPDSDAADAAIPAFDLVDLRNGRAIDLARLRTPGRAMLVWLWAPG